MPGVPVAYDVLDYTGTRKVRILEPTGPCVFAAAVSAAVAIAFLQVLTLSIDTVMLSVLWGEDRERGAGLHTCLYVGTQDLQNTIRSLRVQRYTRQSYPTCIPNSTMSIIFEGLTDSHSVPLVCAAPVVCVHDVVLDEPFVNHSVSVPGLPARRAEAAPGAIEPVARLLGWESG